MTRCAAFVFVFACLPVVAQADRCTLLHLLIEYAQAGYLGTAPVEAYSGTDHCDATYDERGATAYLCRSTFPYRASVATTVFDDLNRDIGQCFEDAVTLPADTAVNHPDSYDLRRYKIENMSVAISLKDKAALDQTLMFLRLNRE